MTNPRMPLLALPPLLDGNMTCEYCREQKPRRPPRKKNAIKGKVEVLEDESSLVGEVGGTSKRQVFCRGAGIERSEG